MSTNYYVAQRPTIAPVRTTVPKWGQTIPKITWMDPHPTHMCKSGRTWRAYSEFDWDLGQVRTVAEWRDLIFREGLLILDEQGGVHNADQFWAYVEGIPLSERRSQYDYIHTTDLGFLDADDYSLDPEGFTMTRSELQ